MHSGGSGLLVNDGWAMEGGRPEDDMFSKGLLEGGGKGGNTIEVM